MNKSSILASSLGNITEWYDFGLFSAFSSLFAQLFFPNEKPEIALIQVFGIFALGFICRPLGSFIFGHFGDHIGRVKTLRASILLISIPTLFMAFLPTYHQVGIWSPILLIILRLIQGISLGGEYTGNIIYLVESAPKNHRALTVSLAPTAANFGILFATAVVLFFKTHLSVQAYQEYGWRIPFIFGAFISWGVLFLRQSFVETKVFDQLRIKHKVAEKPILLFFKTMPWHMLKIFGLVCIGAVLYYLCFIFMEDYLNTYANLSKNDSLIIISACIITMLVLVPLFGFLCDKIGRRKSYFIFTLGVVFFTIPCFHLLLSHHFYAIIFVMLFFTLLSSLEQCTTSVTVVEQFPANIRYSGVSISYNLTQAIIGGSSPFIAATLLAITHKAIAPAYYLTFVGIITLFTVIFFLKETKGISLEDGNLK